MRFLLKNAPLAGWRRPFRLPGDMAVWEPWSNEYQGAYRRIVPLGIDLAIFEGRGDYGHDFAPQARVGRSGKPPNAY
jgi:hypothetical protein